MRSRSSKLTFRRGRLFYVSSSLALLAACGLTGTDTGTGGGGDQSSAAESIERRAGALTRTLDEVLANKILVPDTPTGMIAASTVGYANVGEDGSAEYTIPISVPDGINGLQPKLGINYRSTSTGGSFGPGWGLGGISTITRCPKTLAQDGAQAAVDYRGDVFCLDGQRLVRTSGTANGVGELRTERNPFAKISVTSVDAATSSPATFEVRLPDGKIYRYGLTAGSRLWGRPYVFPSGTAALSTYAWYVERIEDRFGNTIDFTYNNTLPSSTTESVVTELVPASINYGGSTSVAARRGVTFVYEALVKDQAHTRWVSGLGLVGGQYIREIHTRGPTGATANGEMFIHKFTYSTTMTSTKARLLKQIQECDYLNVCKKPTTIAWEAGLQTYDAVDVTDSQGLYDLMPSVFDSGVDVSNVYRRVIAVDLNHDGLDDLVYRRFLGYGNCLGWAYYLARKASWLPSGVEYTSGNYLWDLNDDPDPSCNGSSDGPYPGDVLFADLNRDGFPDIISSRGKHTGGPAGPTSLSGYTVLFNRALTDGTVGFGAPVAFEDSSVAKTMAPISVGDINGDGTPEIVRPKTTNALWAATVTPTGAQLKTVANISQTSLGFSLTDIDGDGTAEVLRDTSATQVMVTSPTMNGALPNVPGSQPGMPPSSIRWQLDLNGDGLLDIVYAKPDQPGNLVSLINTGKGFISGITTVLGAGRQVGQSWFKGAEDGVRVVDVNSDGRQDLLLVDNGATSTTSTRTNVTALISDGNGAFSVSVTAIPVGLASDGVFALPSPAHGYRTSLVLDADGNGLADVMQLTASGRVMLYKRQGKLPDVVTGITAGLGAQVAYQYEPLSNESVYEAGTCPAGTRFTCQTPSGRWVVSNLSVFGGDTSRSQYFSYATGIIDNGGRGFQGFKRRNIVGPSSVAVQIVTNTEVTSDLKPGTYTYPYAFTPASTRKSTQTEETRYLRSETTAEGYDLRVNADGTYVVMPKSKTTTVADCNDPVWDTTVLQSSASCQTPRRLSKVDETYVYDLTYGFRKSRSAATSDSTRVIQTDSEALTYYPADTTSWLTSLVKQVTRTSAPWTQQGVTRTTTYAYDMAKGFLTTIDVEPTTPKWRLTRTIVPDTRGRVASISDVGFADAGATTQQTRTTTYLYEDADGIYPTTITSNALPSRLWWDPSRGVVVEADDANGIASTNVYDTFGRPRFSTSSSGATTKVLYLDSKAQPAGGVDIEVTPENVATRKVTLHLDPMGNEVSRTMPVDATKSLRTTTGYDWLGRVTRRQEESVVGSTATQLRYQNFYFDDLGRSTMVCGPNADNSGVCARTTYDGLTKVETDPANRVVTTIYDALGRQSVQRVTNATGVSTDATYRFKEFNLPGGVTMSDGSQVTYLEYDVLGRLYEVSRTGAGTRRYAHNAFGEKVTASKVNANNTLAETVTFVPDLGGRLKSMTATGLTRTFSWDKTAAGAVQANSLGKLVDVQDTTSGVSIHFDYNATGLPSRKTWTVPKVTSGTESYFSDYTYDAQGRLATLTYPLIPGEAAALKVGYAYDVYNGATQKIFDTAAPTTPIWSATARNERGWVTQESMVLGGPTLTRATTYYAPDNSLKTATLTGSNGASSETYTYDDGGLPKTVAMSGLGGSWTQSFGYDNFARLSAWTPASGAPTVSFGYDADGNLLSRSWSGESVAYGAITGGARNVKVTQGTTVVKNENYLIDLWGRTSETPAVKLTYNPLDELSTVVEKLAGNQSNALKRDGFGNRVMTVYGASGTAGTLLTLGKNFELKRTSTLTEGRCRISDGKRVVGDVVRTNNGARTATFYLTDAVGSVVAEGSSAGIVTARSRRDPFGNLLSNAATPYLPADPTAADGDGTSRLGFGLHSRDKGWGIVDMAARGYSPRLGRFLSADGLIANPYDRQLYNPFAYVRNLPHVSVDPTGNAEGPAPEGDPNGGAEGAEWDGVETAKQIGRGIAWTGGKIWSGLKTGYGGAKTGITKGYGGAKTGVVAAYNGAKTGVVAAYNWLAGGSGDTASGGTLPEQKQLTPEEGRQSLQKAQVAFNKSGNPGAVPPPPATQTKTTTSTMNGMGSSMMNMGAPNPMGVAQGSSTSSSATGAGTPAQGGRAGDQSNLGSASANALGGLADATGAAIQAGENAGIASSGLLKGAHVVTGVSLLTDGYSVYDSVSEGKVPLSGTVGLLGWLVPALFVVDPPVALVVGISTGAFSFAYEDPKVDDVKAGYDQKVREYGGTNNFLQLYFH
jgi:RHS repeat-associated protein